MSYESFPSIERLENIYCIITEKVDGTNGLIELNTIYNNVPELRFGSKNRYISYNDDNAGFCSFYRHYEDNFRKLAVSLLNMSDSEENQKYMFNYPIRIHGEWFGSSIQRTYGLKDKFFMPFSTFITEQFIEYQIPNIVKPNVMYTGKFSMDIVETCMQELITNGSGVVLGYKSPEGIVIHFPKYNFRLKQTFEGSKWQNNIPKPEHDKKPKETKPDLIYCEVCGKRLYTNKQTGDLECMNYHCLSSHMNPNYKG